MSTADRLAEFLNHPAPGLVFGPHKDAQVGRRAYATPHLAGEPASSQDLRTLQAIMSGHSEVHRPLLECYRQANGAALCMLWEDINKREVAALTLLPVEDWDAATEPWVSGDMVSFMEGCEIFKRGTWKVIADLPSEGQSLVYFFDGVHEDKPLAGKMFCIGLDGLLGFEEVLAPSFEVFVAEFTRDPAAFFKRIGFTWHVGRDGSYWGDPVEAYVPDVRGHPDLTEWKR